MTSDTGTITLATLQSGLESRLEAVRARIGSLVAADFDLIDTVNAHLLQMQGKMFRPTMLLLAGTGLFPIQQAAGQTPARPAQDCSGPNHRAFGF